MFRLCALLAAASVLLATSCSTGRPGPTAVAPTSAAGAGTDDGAAPAPVVLYPADEIAINVISAGSYIDYASSLSPSNMLSVIVSSGSGLRHDPGATGQDLTAFVLKAADEITLNVISGGSYMDYTAVLAPSNMLGIVVSSGSGLRHDPAQSEQAPAAFVLKTADTITVNVWRHEDLSETVLIAPSGTVQLPLIGEVRAAGKTTAELKTDIETRLKRYVVTPKVDVTVSSLGETESVTRTVQIGADGNIQLPLVGQVKAGGLTVTQLKQDLESRMAVHMLYPRATVTASSLGGDEDLSRTVQIDPSGHIQFPLVGEVRAAGRTTEALARQIQTALRKHLVNPRVDVGISALGDSEDIARTAQIDAEGRVELPHIGQVKVTGMSLTDLKAHLESLMAKHMLNPRVALTASSVGEDVDLTRTVVVDPSGHIQFPLIGELRAAGLGVSQLAADMEQRLNKYLVNPRVDIAIASLEGQRVFVLGEVESPGTLTLDRQLSLWEAIVSSGGLTADAHPKKVLLVRHDATQTTITVLPSGLAQNHGTSSSAQWEHLRQGDIVFVPTRGIAKVESFMTRISTIIRPILNIETGISIWPEVVDAINNADSSQSQTVVVSSD